MGGDCVEAVGLAKRYPGGVWGARDISFRAGYGGVTVLVGPNGAGKTTTVGMLSTVLRPTRGRGIVAGFDVVSEAWRVRERIALVPQEARIDLNWTPWEAVKWYLVARGWPLGEAARRAREVLESLGLWEVRSRVGWSLSGGQRRKVVTAMALASEAEVVFLDEPTTGLDVESRYAVWEALRREAGRGRCILFTTHDMREAEGLADNAVLIHEGRVVAYGAPARLREKLLPGLEYRVVVRGAQRVPVDAARSMLRVGGTVILYAGSKSEAYTLASLVEGGSVTVEPVGFEDVYLKAVHGGSGGGEGSGP